MKLILPLSPQLKTKVTKDERVGFHLSRSPMVAEVQTVSTDVIRV